MAKKRRVIHKLKTAGAAFDDQLWPVCVALVVLGGFAAGVVLAFFRPDDPRLFYNAWTYLVPIPILVALVIWGVSRIDSRTIRRGVLLSVVLSIIAHIIFLGGSEHIIWWRMIQDIVGNRQDLVRRIERVAPEYDEVQIDSAAQPKPDFARPVETETPEIKPDEIKRRPTEPDETKQKPQLAPVPEPTETFEPHAIPRKQIVESAPRRDEQQSKLSRQLTRVAPQTSRPVAMPEINVPRPREPAKIEARSLAAQRQATQSEASRVPTPPALTEPATALEHPTVEIARRETQRDTTAESTAAPTLPRQVRRPRRLPHATVPMAAVAAPDARRTSPEAVEPTHVAMGKQLTAAPRIARRSVEPAAEAPATIAERIAVRQQPSERGPTLARTPKSIPSRRARPTVRPSVATLAADVESTSSPTTSTTVELRPSTSAVSRQVGRTVSAQAEPRSLGAPASADIPQIARTHARRAPLSTVPTIDPTAGPSHSPARALRTATVAASPVPVAAPAGAPASRVTSRPAAEPARAALARSFGGTAGIGRAPNMDRGLPAPQRTALVASGAARRSRATQRTEPGPAISPSAPARIGRARSGADAPTSTLVAQVVERAVAGGSEQPAELDADAGAALARADADASLGAITAAMGTVDVDFGPTQVVSNTGAGRASGGGQPMLNPDTRARRVARSRTGGGPTMALATAAVAEEPEAPDGSGGGEPPSVEADIEAVATVRTSAGGDMPAGGGPSSIDQTGPVALAGVADLVGRAKIGRARTIQAEPGAPEPGGGTVSPSRAATSRAPVANTRAEIVATAGAAEPGSAPQGPPLEAQGAEVARAALGAIAPVTSRPTGAASGSVPVDSPVVDRPAAAAAIGRRKKSPGNDDGPMIAAKEYRGAPLRRAARVNLPTGTVAPVDAPPGGIASPVARPDVEQMVGGLDAAGIARLATGGLAVEVDAPEGPGGLGSELTADAGIVSRRARSESTEIHFRTARFRRSRTGGPPAVNVTASTGTPAYRNRRKRRTEGSGTNQGYPPPKTEEAIERGLQWLAREQESDGSWSLTDFAADGSGYERERAILHTDTAATGLALLTFLGAGYDHREDKYRDVVRAGIDYLIKNQKPDGDLYDDRDPLSHRSVWLYSHGLAAIALSEAYGMTQDPKLRPAAQKALDFIGKAQHKERGGWRYSPGVGTDTSVTGWLMMALKSGELAGLDVPPQAFQKIEHWLDVCRASEEEPYLFRYNPYAPVEIQRREGKRMSAAHGRVPNKTMTSVGLLMRLYLGWRRDNPNMARGADHLMENLPAIGSRRNPERDTYYWYYATQVMFHMGGRYWQAWNQRLHPLLVDNQVQTGPMAGSWDPLGPIPDRWGPHAGRIYVTTLNLLSLEVYYRHLPIYEDTLK